MPKFDHQKNDIAINISLFYSAAKKLQRRLCNNGHVLTELEKKGDIVLAKNADSLASLTFLLKGAPWAQVKI